MKNGVSIWELMVRKSPKYLLSNRANLDLSLFKQVQSPEWVIWKSWDYVDFARSFIVTPLLLWEEVSEVTILAFHELYLGFVVSLYDSDLFFFISREAFINISEKVVKTVRYNLVLYSLFILSFQRGSDKIGQTILSNDEVSQLDNGSKVDSFWGPWETAMTDCELISFFLFFFILIVAKHDLVLGEK